MVTFFKHADEDIIGIAWSIWVVSGNAQKKKLEGVGNLLETDGDVLVEKLVCDWI